MDTKDIDNYFLSKHERLTRKETRQAWLMVVFAITLKLVYSWGATGSLNIFGLLCLLAISVWAIVLMRKKSSSILMRFLFVGSSFCIWSTTFLTILFLVLSYDNRIFWFPIVVLLALIGSAIVIILVRRSIISACDNEGEVKVPGKMVPYVAGLFTFCGALGIVFARNLFANVSEDAVEFLVMGIFSFAVVMFSAITSVFYYKAYLILRYSRNKFLR